LTDPQFSIILPVYNQADHIGSIVDAYVTALSATGLAYEIVLVVNGSPRDGSFAACEALAQQYPAVRAVDEPQGGWGRAVKRGIREARGTSICYTNSARTTDRDLTLLLLYARAFPNVVVKANRKIRESLQRRVGSLLYNIECRTLFDLSCWDVNGTPKVFPRSCDALLSLQSDDDIIDAEFNALVRQHEYPMIEVPIFSTRRHGGKSTTNYGSAFAMYTGAYRLFRRLRQRPGA
jgi:glycosyltransferase involved in cell wall biosynthesis